ncbi:MAG: F0F1 ATP synthase subunit A [Pirellulaceae bacterium]
MASSILHIKDSYYFGVPKSLWRADHTSKDTFPDVWVKLDPDFQRWQVEHFYESYSKLKGGDVPSLEQITEEYVEWKQDHANMGRPFPQFLQAKYDLAGDLQGSEFAARWTQTLQNAPTVHAYQRDTSITWSPEKIDAYNHHLSGKIIIPQPYGELRNLYQAESGLCISKFMILEVVAALILCAVFAWLARRVGTGDRPRGRVWNLLEVFVLFIRDEVARPAIGKHDADHFVPLLLTMFFFILTCNLFGMIPWMGTPTASFGATFGMACITFLTVFVSGMRRFGPIGFFVNMAPKFDLTPDIGGILGLPLKAVAFLFTLAIQVFILAIEVVGLFIRHTVLAIRLLANMVAGHIVLLAIMTLAFSVEGAMSPSWSITACIAVVGSTLFSGLELFVAFLQAYIFTFLSALFIGLAIHHH